MPTMPSEAALVRPPVRSLRWMETFLDILLSYGFDDDAAVTAYRAYSTFLLSQLLIEGSARRPVGAVPDAAAIGDLTDFPHVHRLRDKLAQDHSLGEFEDALEALIDRLGRTTDATAFDVEVDVLRRTLGRDFQRGGARRYRRLTPERHHHRYPAGHAGEGGRAASER